MLTITESVMGSSVEMAIALWLLLAGPFYSPFCYHSSWEQVWASFGSEITTEKSQSQSE